MPELILIEEIRDQLVTDGVGQLPQAAPSTVVPSIWLHPRDGAPEPRAGEDATLTLIATGQVPNREHEGFLEERVVDVVVRSRKSKPGELLQRVVRSKLHDRREFFLSDLRVEWSMLWRGTQPLASDETSYTTVQSFRIAARTKSLAGLPYAP